MFLPDKPPIEDLQYFLDFQIARAWAPEQSNLQRKEPVCSSLQFSLMGPKLFISADQVTQSDQFICLDTIRFMDELSKPIAFEYFR